MQEVRGNFRGKKRKQNKSGCCLSRFLVLIIVFAVIGYFGYQAAEKIGLKTYLLQAKYPIRYQDFVEEYAEEFDLDEGLVYAVIHTESKFDTYAESSAGAKGLMQLTDETGEDCARRLKVQNFSAQRLFDPDINIRLGCYYLKQLILLFLQLVLYVLFFYVFELQLFLN